MQPQFEHPKLNGSITKDENYIWAGALTLAWKDFKDTILKEDVKIVSDDPEVQSIAFNFNKASFSKNHLNKDCYYIKTGPGNQTIRQINTEVKKKFPDKSTTPLKEDLPDDGIVSFAYLFKSLQFEFPFEKKKITFNEKPIPGFTAKKLEQKQQVIVHSYENIDNFMVHLILKNSNDSIFIIKTENDSSPEEILTKVQKSKKGVALSNSDIFEMPIIKLHHSRQVSELKNKTIGNKELAGYKLAEIYEIIKLDIDEKGVKLENQGVIRALKCKVKAPENQKMIVLNKVFWIVMKENKQHPYLVAKIVNP